MEGDSSTPRSAAYRAKMLAESNKNKERSPPVSPPSPPTADNAHTLAPLLTSRGVEWPVEQAGPSQPREVPLKRRAFQRIDTRIDGTAHDAAAGARLEDHVAQIALSLEEHGQAVGVVEQHVERRHESQGLKLALAERRDAPALQQGRPAHKLEHGHRLGPGLLGFDRRPSLSTLGLERLLLRGGEILWNASLLPQVSAQKVEPRVLQEVGHAPATRRALELGDEAGRNLVVDLGLRCEPCRRHAEARCA